MSEDASRRRTAALVFSRMVRDAKVRSHIQRRTPGRELDTTRSVVCLETDDLGTIISTIDRHYPVGAVVSVFYPDTHKFRFMTWTANDESPGGIDTHEKTTIGMAIDAIDAEHGQWTSKVSKAFSTLDIEKQLTSV